MFQPITNLGQLLCQPILNADTYKATHWTFEHPSFQGSYSYIEARKGGEFKEVQFFGLQYVLRYYLSQRVTFDMIDEAEAELTAHGIPFNRSAWERVVRVHSGRLPVIIKAIPEGMVVPQGTVLVTVESTDPEIAGLASYVETLLLRAVWYPTTIASRSRRWWKLIHRYLEESGDPSTTDFKLVDFGSRGAAATEAAAIGGMAHLVNFQVTDNLMGIRFAKHAYPWNGMPGFSIPATEHSVTTSWGQDGELDFFKAILARHGSTPNPIGGRYPVSVVIDTYNQDNALRMWGTTLKEDLIASNMQLVARPDSGDPIINVVHCLDLLGSLFGFTVNDKGFRVLPDCVRVIQGDGINEETLRRILQRAVYHKWSVDNLVFGSGGGLLVHAAERDTHRFAMKASEVVIDGTVREIQKLVATDPSKASKKGRFAVIMDEAGTGVETISEDDLEPGMHNLLGTVFSNGGIISPTSFADVRNIAHLYR